MYASASKLVTASTRRRFAPTLVSDVIFTKPISLGGRHMRAAAQLLRESFDVEHAHELAVLLAEQRHDAGFTRRRERRLVGAHGMVLHDLLVRQALHLGDLLGRHGLEGA